MSAADLPPPPPGFELETDGTALPPPPPGFELEDVSTMELAPAPRAAEQAAPDEGAAPRPSLFRADSDFTDRTGLSQLDLIWPAAQDMFGSRRAAGETIAKKVGGRLIDDEGGGDPLLLLPSGERYRLNDPGFDPQDVANFTGNALAFLAPASWAARLGQARNFGLGARAATQAAAAMGTDAALQAGFNGGEFDGTRNLLAGAGGAGGELVGRAIGAIGRRVAEGRRGATPANVREARALAESTGADALPPEQINRLAGAIPELRAGTDPRALVGREAYGFEYTQGQRAVDPARRFELLSREEVLRQNPAGGVPFRRAADANAERLDNALTGISTRIGGSAGATPAELAQGAASRVRAQADELGDRITDAYAKAGQGARAAISADAIGGLPRLLRTSVAEFAPNSTTTPVAAQTLEQIQLATDTILKGAEGGRVTGLTLKALETQRRIINNNINAATNNADRAAMTKIKREFDGWLDESIETALVSGDPAALQALKEARALRSEYGRRFEGREEADRFIGGLLDGSRTPEELVNIALGASQVSKAGGARFIERLRTAAGDDPGVIGNLRAAHFMRLTRGPDGKPLAMGEIVRNIASTEYSNASVVKALYGPKEWGEIKRLASALDPLVAKGDFARTSGTAERMARMMFQRIGGGLPVVGELVQAVGNARAWIAAERALSQPLRLPVRSSPAGVAVAGELVRNAPGIVANIEGGTPGAWTAEDDRELERLRAQAAALRAEVEGR